MSFLHIHSSECLKSELDLFSLPPTQTSIESLQWIYYKSVTSLADDASIEFGPSQFKNSVKSNCKISM